MTSLTYLNFDLTFESNADGYAVRVTDSPAGQAAAPFLFPFNELELENFLLRLGQRSSGTRRADSPEMELSKQFGGRLFDALFDDDVRAALRSSIRAGEEQGAGLRIRLRFGNTPELADIPWEYLYDGGANRFLTLSRETPLVRYLDLSRPVEPLQVTAPLRILVMISDPSDYDRLDVEAEWQRLLTATADLRERRLVEIVRLDRATLLELQRQLRDNQFHIFHYIGHGVFDEGADDGFLVLEEDNGRGRKVSGQYVGTLLADHRSLRLAVLNSCEGGRSSRSDPFAGAAQSLVQQGLPAVIAMQFEISDDAAAVFAQEFYMALADGYPVDAALAEGRRAIFATKTNAEWGIPVLFMRAADGRIFDVQTPVVPSAPPVETPASVAESGAVHLPSQSTPADKAPAVPAVYPPAGREETTAASALRVGTGVEENVPATPRVSTPDDLRKVKIIGGVILGAFVVLALIFYLVSRNSTVQSTPVALVPPTINFFSAEPSQIVAGENQTVQLTWSIAGDMTGVTVAGPGIDSSLALSRTGSLLVSLDQSATFSLAASNYDQTNSQPLTISAVSPSSAPAVGWSTSAADSVDVTVTFNSVRIIDDCDTVLTGLGEFWLDLTVNDQHLRWPETGTNEVDSGQSYAIGQSITTRVADGERLVITGAGFEVDEFQTESMGSIRVSHSASDDWGAGSDSQTSLAVCQFVLGYSIDAIPVSLPVMADSSQNGPTQVADSVPLREGCIDKALWYPYNSQDTGTSEACLSMDGWGIDARDSGLEILMNNNLSESIRQGIFVPIERNTTITFNFVLSILYTPIENDLANISMGVISSDSRDLDANTLLIFQKENPKTAYPIYLKSKERGGYEAYLAASDGYREYKEFTTQEISFKISDTDLLAIYIDGSRVMQATIPFQHKAFWIGYRLPKGGQINAEISDFVIHGE